MTEVTTAHVGTATRTNIGSIEERISSIIARVKPYVQSHGGDVDVESINGDVLTLKITGNCAQCLLVNMTYNKVVKTLIEEEVPEIERVVLV